MQFSGFNQLFNIISYWNLNHWRNIIIFLVNLTSVCNVVVSLGTGYNVAVKYNRPYSRWRQSLTPCAWLERGGFFNMPKYYNSLSPFVQRRHVCSGYTTCPLTWLPTNDVRSLTFKLIGTDDMRDYEFQAHFCNRIYEARHRYCTNEEGEIAFELRQIGTWLMVDRINCRCLGIADVERYGYSKGVQFGDRVFRGNYIHMTCATKPQCKIDDFCYIETPSTDGYIYGGRVPCICPKQYHCPIYFIRDKRIPQLNDDGRVISYGVKCKRRNY
uniref:DUF5731 domain-containing protein n=1 Tax=Trichobilharzia regenti TaxID=157069 RepID=A0AA85K3G9_TRIRE|nr:unnamed protein product [Trichobilharzia regenti]